MRNRAKCKLCEEIIESFHQHDFVRCKCGEIHIDGGPNNPYPWCGARDWANFLRVDDEGNIIVPKIIEKDKEEPVKPAPPPRPDKKELLGMLEEMVKAYDSLPPQGMESQPTNYDLYAALSVVLAILKEEK